MFEGLRWDLRSLKAEVELCWSHQSSDWFSARSYEIEKVGEVVWWGAKMRHVCPWNGSKWSSWTFSGQDGNVCAGREDGCWCLTYMYVTCLSLPLWKQTSRWSVPKELQPKWARKTFQRGKRLRLWSSSSFQRCFMQCWLRTVHSRFKEKFKEKTSLGQGNLWVVPRSQRT